MDRIMDDRLNFLCGRPVKTPQEARSLLKANPDLPRPSTLRLIQDILQREMAEYDYLQDFFKHELPQEEARWLFLFSGPGFELIPARKANPDAQIAAVDQRVTPESVVTEVLSKANFYEQDLQGLGFEDLVDLVGFKPTAIVARHPEVAWNIWTPPFLADLANSLRRLGGTMIVTTYQNYESSIVNRAMEEVGIRPDVFEFIGGRRMKEPYLQGALADRYISVIS